MLMLLKIIQYIHARNLTLRDYSYFKTTYRRFPCIFILHRRKDSETQLRPLRERKWA